MNVSVGNRVLIKTLDKKKVPGTITFINDDIKDTHPIRVTLDEKDSNGHIFYRSMETGVTKIIKHK